MMTEVFHFGIDYVVPTSKMPLSVFWAGVHLDDQPGNIVLIADLYRSFTAYLTLCAARRTSSKRVVTHMHAHKCMLSTSLQVVTLGYGSFDTGVAELVYSSHNAIQLCTLKGKAGRAVCAACSYSHSKSRTVCITCKYGSSRQQDLESSKTQAPQDSGTNRGPMRTPGSRRSFAGLCSALCVSLPCGQPESTQAPLLKKELLKSCNVMTGASRCNQEQLNLWVATAYTQKHQ